MSKLTLTQRVVGTGAAVAVSAGFGLATAPEAQADVWDRVAACESGNNWNINTGNGYYGGLQFTPSTWRANGGSGSPAGASKAEQKRVARNTLKTQGPGAWPVCSRKAGLTRSNGGSSSSYSAPKSSQRASSNSDSSYRSNKTSRSSDRSTTSSKSSYRSNTSSQSSKGSSSQRSYTPKRSNGYKAPTTNYTPRRAFTGKTATVQAGDTLNKLAARYGVSGGWRSLYKMNSGKISNPNLIYVGQVLNVG